MIIEKVLNNNIVSSIDNSGRELVIIGRGIGFGKKPGDELDDSAVEKVFTLNNNDDSRRFQEIIEGMPIEHIRLSDAIIDYAKQKTDIEFSRSIYITLTDHLNFALERFRKGLEFSNQLKWEIKRFYPVEYEVGMKALDIIDEELGVLLPDDEAASIAMHFVNAETKSSNMNNAIKITEFIQKIESMVINQCPDEVSEDTVYFESFISHLKLLAKRIIFNEEFDEESDDDLFDIVKTKYVRSYGIAEKIGKYIKEEYKTDISNEEKMYLSVYIRKIIKE